MKLTILAVTALALCWALLNRDSVFSLVILAWSGLACALAPLLLSRVFGLRPGQVVSMVAVLLGVAVAMIWRQLGWHHPVYEGLPGILLGLLLLYAGHLMQQRQALAAMS